MTRYFFSVTNGAPHTDHDGKELADEHDAWREALGMMGNIEDHLAQNGRWQLDVTDAAGAVHNRGCRTKARAQLTFVRDARAQILQASPA